MGMTTTPHPQTAKELRRHLIDFHGLHHTAAKGNMARLVQVHECQHGPSATYLQTIEHNHDEAGR